MSASWSQMRRYYLCFGVKIYKLQKCHSHKLLSNDRRYICLSSACFKEKKRVVHESATYNIPTEPGAKKDTSCRLPDTYSSKFVEAAWYDWWVKQGFFSPTATSTNDKGQGRNKFTICLPPPNVTGTLHLGHALTCAVQDALVRWHRMRGDETLWIPGCDHAGIATQVVVEKQLWKEEKKTRHDLGREEFLRRVWDWKYRKGDSIYEQMKKLGASLDWTQATFTMDPGMSQAVTEAFVRLHDEGQVYRSNRLVNWSCQLKSAISDIEVENVSIEGPTKMSVPGYKHPQMFGEISSFHYPVYNSDERVTVATTRLETMLGDTAVAVHPDDPRYKHLHGQQVRHPIDGRLIPIVCDTYVDMTFGTGAVKITPAHDHNDNELGQRHGLPSINVINDVGEMENVTHDFLGMKRFDARRKLEKVLKERGLLKEKRPHAMVLPVCSRSRDIIEPRLKAQWYVSCTDMARFAVKAVEDGDLTFTPDFYKKIWFEFLKDCQDWCISRQIWWGHRIPAYKVTLRNQEQLNDQEMWVSGRSQQEACSRAAAQLGVSLDQLELHQDEDVLDTWFSSALIPFSVHGWPEETESVERFYPSTMLETGSDILFFWVARMVMMGHKMTGQLPFSQVLLHGLLRDSQGRKMSKSLGNVIDPMDVIHGISLEELHRQVESGNLDPREVETAKKGQRSEFPQGIPECGTDALRFALTSYNFKDMEIMMNMKHVIGYRRFCNKIWQSFKYVTEKLGPEFEPVSDIQSIAGTSSVDDWILHRLSETVLQCDVSFKSYDLQFVTKALYTFWISDFCDVYLESSKHVFNGGNESRTDTTKQILHLCTDTFLRALSPFMPYLTEELFQRLPVRGDNSPISVCVAPYPDPSLYNWTNSDLDLEMNEVKAVSNGIMSVVQGLNLKRNYVQVYINTDEATSDLLKAYEYVLKSLTLQLPVSIATESDLIPDGCLVKVVSPSVRVSIKYDGEIDVTYERDRILKKSENLKKKLVTHDAQLQKLKSSNKSEHLVHEQENKIATIQTELEQVHQLLEQFKTLSAGR